MYIHVLYVLICDTFVDMSYYGFIYKFVDLLPVFVVVKALQSLCCVMFHIYDVK